MRRIRLIIAYEGTEYVGWQRQPNGLAIQELLENALFDVTGEKLTIHGSGRTDSGVHARAQVAHFDTSVRMPADKFAIAMNMRLPRDIRVLYSEETDDNFHSRFSAKRKHYRYTVQTGTHADVFMRNTALHVHSSLDYELLCRSAQHVIGSHDFRAFMSSGVTMENTVRTVFNSAWSKNGRCLYYDIEGNGFLYNMVRILVGTMLDMGSGVLDENALVRALDSHSRTDAGATAPAQGLMLYSVSYEGLNTEEILNRGL